MTTNRRNFLQKTGMLLGAFSAGNLFNQAIAADLQSAERKLNNLSDEAIAADEDYWSVIQQAYTVIPTSSILIMAA